METISLELQNTERDLKRLIPFVRRQISPVRWHFLPALSLTCICMGVLFTLYRLATMNAYHGSIIDSNNVASPVAVKQTLFEAIWIPMTVLFLGLFFLAMVIRRVPGEMKKLISANASILQTFALIISEEGLTKKINGNEKKHEWNLIKTCYEKLGGLIIVFQSNDFIFISAKKLSEENYLKVRKIFSEKTGITQD